LEKWLNKRGGKVMNYSDFMEVVNEHVDIHSKNAGLLTKLNEAERDGSLDLIAKNLYGSIIANANDIDYGEIPNSAGDITKLSNYKTLNEAISNIEKVLIEYREDTSSVQVVKDAMNNMVALKPQFTLGYTTGVDIIKILYNNIVLGIIASVSHLLAAITDYMVSTNKDFSINLDKAALRDTKSNILFQTLKSFNNSCSNGKMKKVLQDLNREANGARGFAGFVALNGMLAIGIIMIIIPILRNLIYFFYNARVSVSDYLDIQSEILKMNVLELESSDRKDRKEISKKQKAIIGNIEKLSDKIRVKHNTAESKTKKEIEKAEKIQANDIIDNNKKPDSLF
jgi:hypothetical protein